MYSDQLTRCCRATAASSPGRGQGNRSSTATAASRSLSQLSTAVSAARRSGKHYPPEIHPPQASRFRPHFSHVTSKPTYHANSTRLHATGNLSVSQGTAEVSTHRRGCPPCWRSRDH